MGVEPGQQTREEDLNVAERYSNTRRNLAANSRVKPRYSSDGFQGNAAGNSIWCTGPFDGSLLRLFYLIRSTGHRRRDAVALT
jgi:hypothetical protein